MRSPESVRRYRDADNRKRRAARARRVPTRGPRSIVKPRPVVGNTCRVGVCLTPTELATIDAAAARLAMSRSEFLRLAAFHWIRSREASS